MDNVVPVTPTVLNVKVLRYALDVSQDGPSLKMPLREFAWPVKDLAQLAKDHQNTVLHVLEEPQEENGNAEIILSSPSPSQSPVTLQLRFSSPSIKSNLVFLFGLTKLTMTPQSSLSILSLVDQQWSQEQQNQQQLRQPQDHLTCNQVCLVPRQSLALPSPSQDLQLQRMDRLQRQHNKVQRQE